MTAEDTASDPAPDPADAPGRPSSVTRAIRMHVLLLLLGLVGVVLTVVANDALIRSWAQGRPDLRRVLNTQGLQAIKDGEVRPPAFVAPSITLYVVIVLLMWMLLVFFANGNGWARLCLTALLFFTAVTTVAGIRTDPPAVFVVLSVASLVLEVVAVAYLWHPDTTKFLKRVPAPEAVA